MVQYPYPHLTLSLLVVAALLLPIISPILGWTAGYGANYLRDCLIESSLFFHLQLFFELAVSAGDGMLSCFPTAFLSSISSYHHATTGFCSSSTKALRAIFIGTIARVGMAKVEPILKGTSLIPMILHGTEFPSLWFHLDSLLLLLLVV